MQRDKLYVLVLSLIGVGFILTASLVGIYPTQEYLPFNTLKIFLNNPFFSSITGIISGEKIKKRIDKENLKRNE